MSSVFTRFHLVTFLITLGSLLLFIVLTLNALSGEPVTGIDRWAYHNITLVHTPWLTQLFLFITNLFTPINIFLLTIGLLLLLLIKGKWEHMYILIFSLLGGVIIETLLKTSIGRDRPLPILIAEPGFSFPSGHATISTIFLVLLIYAYKSELKRAAIRHIAIAAAIAMFLLVAVTRVYLGVHWVSDVVAGVSLGIFWLTLHINAARVLNHFQKKKSLRMLV